MFYDVFGGKFYVVLGIKKLFLVVVIIIVKFINFLINDGNLGFNIMLVNM